jgi:hypothetical protein
VPLPPHNVGRTLDNGTMVAVMTEDKGAVVTGHRTQRVDPQGRFGRERGVAHLPVRGEPVLFDQPRRAGVVSPAVAWEPWMGPPGWGARQAGLI